jgi:flagellar motor component MotA
LGFGQAAWLACRDISEDLNEEKQMLKLLGFVGMLLMLAVAMNMAAGLGAFVDIHSIVIVFGGAALFALAVGGSTQSAASALDNLGTGAVYFGWLGFLIGIAAIAQNLDTISDEGGLNVIKLGEAFSVGMLTVLYGYLTSWVALPVIKSLTQDD